jgi:hypothetical protein
MSSCPIPIEAVAEPLRKHINPKSPMPLRLMASKGMVPMGPKDMVTVLSCLCFDDDEKIIQSAQKSLIDLPAKIAKGALKEKLHPEVFDHLAHIFIENEDFLETILINQETGDETYAFLAESVNERLLKIIAENQVRILRHPPIAKAIIANPNTIKSTIDRLMDFAVRTGMDFKGLDAFEEAKKRILSTPPDPTENARIQKIVEDSIPEEMFQEEEEPKTSEEAQQQEKKKKNLLAILLRMTPAQKIVAATKGNRSVRMALVKDHNKIVAAAAIKNPGLGESDIIAIAASRSVCDEVIRLICSNREWTRSYAIRLALIQNPKTPVAFSMRFLSGVRTAELKKLAMSKNIPSALATASKKLLQKRQGGGGNKG